MIGRWNADPPEVSARIRRLNGFTLIRPVPLACESLRRPARRVQLRLCGLEWKKILKQVQDDGVVGEMAIDWKLELPCWRYTAGAVQREVNDAL